MSDVSLDDNQISMWFCSKQFKKTRRERKEEGGRRFLEKPARQFILVAHCVVGFRKPKSEWWRNQCKGEKNNNGAGSLVSPNRCRRSRGTFVHRFCRLKATRLYGEFGKQKKDDPFSLRRSLCKQDYERCRSTKTTAFSSSHSHLYISSIFIQCFSVLFSVKFIGKKRTRQEIK